MLLAEISPAATDAATRLLTDSQWGAILIISWGAFFTAIGSMFVYIVTLNRQHRADLLNINTENQRESDAQVKRIMEIYKSAAATNAEATTVLRDTADVVRGLQRSVDTVSAESRGCTETTKRLSIILEARPCLKGGGDGGLR